jgi:hypothetical protein
MTSPARVLNGTEWGRCQPGKQPSEETFGGVVDNVQVWVTIPVMVTKRNKPKLVDQIRKAIEASGKSRYWIARASGVDQATLCRFMAGSGLRVESLEAVALALGLEIVVVEREKKGG